jgi:DNA-directed RNA polymerase I subunit RPA1
MKKIKIKIIMSLIHYLFIFSNILQDHIISAVLLTKKDTFFNRDQFNQLLYCAGLSASSPVPFFGKFGQKVCILNSEDEMKPLLPAIWKPEPLWTGKQVSIG